MVTIREVAERAGVSFATVSHVMNDTRFVSQETRQRVLDAMDELGYRPNILARSLRSGRTHTLGLILPNSSNPYFADIGRSIEETAFKQGYSVILCNSEGDAQKECFYVDVLSRKQVDGIILMAASEKEEALRFILEHDIPVVVVDRDYSDIEVDTAIAENTQGGYLATQHLIGLGHRRIGCITGPSILTPGAKRIIGYRQALEGAGLPFSEELVVTGDYSAKSGLEAATVLLNLKTPPSAIFACNDLMAIGALRAAVALGYHVPDDLSLVGFDDIELASYTNPPLTTIAQPKVEIGYQAVMILIERIKDNTIPYRRVIRPTELIIRESTKPHPG